MRLPSAPSWTSLEPGTVLALVNVALWIVLALRAGVGEQDSTWSLVALSATALLVLALTLAGKEIAVPSRAAAVASAALVAFVALNFLSMLWADVPADALSGAQQAALATASFVMLALWPRRAGGLMLVLGAWAFAVALFALGITTWLALGGDPTRAFDPDGRLDAPIGYPNAAAALWSMAALPCLVIGAQRTASALVRILALGSAALLLQLAVLSQSRGWILAFPVAALVLLVASRSRLRLVLAGAIAAVAVASTLHWTLSPLAALADHRSDADDVVRAAAAALLVASLVAGLLAWLWTWADRRVTVSKSTGHRLGLLLVAVPVLCAAIGVGVLTANRSELSDWVSDHWAQFKEPDYPNLRHGSRFEGGLGSHRSQEWSIAWGEFKAHPLVGVGADNYHGAWMLHRTDGTKSVRYPHSLPLRMLSELGLVGSALFIAFLAGAVIALLRLRSGEEWDLRLAAAIPLVYWLVHGTIDWFWEIPALTASALGLLGLGLAATMRAGAVTRTAARIRWVAIATTTMVVAVTVCTWLSFSYEQEGAASWRATPGAAYADLGRAAGLNPLSARALLVRGSIALRLNDLERAQADFSEALEREKTSWYALFELGLIASEQGDTRAARSYIQRAKRLNPRDPVIEAALKTLNSGRGLDAASLNRRFSDPSNGGR